MGLLGVVCAVVILIHGAVAEHADLIVMLIGIVIDDAVLVQCIDHINEIALLDAVSLAEVCHHRLQCASGVDHRFFIMLLGNQPFHNTVSFPDRAPGLALKITHTCETLVYFYKFFIYYNQFGKIMQRCVKWYLNLKMVRGRIIFALGV